jgi:hypothetical protein
MSHDLATRILADYRSGTDYPEWIINTALELTGDLEHVACSMAGVV